MGLEFGGRLDEWLNKDNPWENEDEHEDDDDDRLDLRDFEALAGGKYDDYE